MEFTGAAERRRRGQQYRQPAGIEPVSVRAGLVLGAHPAGQLVDDAAAARHSASPEAAPLISQVSQLASSTLVTPGTAASARSSRCRNSSPRLASSRMPGRRHGG